MNARLPGTCFDNPIWHRGWRIYVCEHGFGGRYAYVHDSYDPTPQNPGDGPGDDRAGYAASVAEAKAEIDEYEDAKAETADLADALGALGFGGAI